MGFYGNITNTSNTTFQFDRIYPNRLAMDANANNDGIFIGRYVLVEYQEDAAYPVGFKKEDAGNNQFYFYTSPNAELITRIKCLGTKLNITENMPSEEDIEKYPYEDGFYEGEILQYQFIDADDKIKIEFYKCVSSVRGIDAKFELETETNTSSQYIQNFAIDEKHYGLPSKGFKGYDSTVWTKVSETNADGKLITKYVNIADLNSVVPTFDIAADAPTEQPLTPHFDADSTNVYYKLHMQTPFGFRVKETSADKSDEQAVHYTTKYDKETNTTTTTTKTVDADIFYNKDALTFRKNDTSNRVIESGIDEIKIVPTGKSENFSTKYSHYSKGENIGDIQELSVHLPSVGYMVSQGWDIIHGPNRDDAQTDENSSLQGRLDSFKAMEKNAIPMKRNSDGTFVGSRINGNSNKTVGTNKILEENLSTSFDQDDAWIRTEIDTTGLDNTNKLSGISIHHTWHKQADTTSTTNKNINGATSNSTSDKIELYTPIVDKAGHIVGKNIETVTLPYGYKTFTTNGLVNETNADLDASSGRETVASNTQDTLAIDTKNKWLQIEVTNDKIELAHEIHSFDTNSAGHTNLNKENGAKQEDNLTIYDWDYDNAGHITKKKAHTYTLPYSFKYIDVVNDGKEENAAPASMGGTQTADSTQDRLKLTTSNKWILLDGSSEDTVQFGHLLKTVPTTTSTQSLSDEISQVVTFKVYDDSFDEAGHHNGRDTKTITMPFGYGKIKGDTGSTEATATFDELMISANDSWIATTVSNDQVNITHTGPVATSVTNKSNVVDPNFGSTFTIEDWYFDAKGHKHTGTTHTVQFPKGSLNDLTATGSSVLTGISMVDETGDITQQNANVGTLTLAEYIQGQSGGLKISDTNTINGAFKGIQDYINTLDMSDTSNTQFITKITQIDGQVAVERAAAGTLQLGTASTDGTIPATSSLNNAFNITNNRIKAEEDALAKEIQDRKDAIDALTGTKDYSEHFDTMKEIADWLDANKDGVVDITLGVTANSNAIKTEELRATAKETEITNALTEEAGRATAAEQELQEQINALGTAAKENKEYFATAKQGSTADATAATIATYGDIVNYDAEDFVSKEEYNALLSDFNDLKALVEQLNNQINPPQEPDEGGETV